MFPKNNQSILKDLTCDNTKAFFKDIKSQTEFKAT